MAGRSRQRGDSSVCRIPEYNKRTLPGQMYCEGQVPCEASCNFSRNNINIRNSFGGEVGGACLCVN